MQAAKDSFYMALRSRLAELNPQRTSVIGGVTRPAIMVIENERTGEEREMNETFCLTWGAPGAAEQGGSLQSLKCTVTYQTKGSEGSAGIDRGRTLGAMDRELAQICSPTSVDKADYTQTPPGPLGTSVFWGTPVLGDAEFDGQVIRRMARITVYFIPEEA